MTPRLRTDGGIAPPPNPRNTLLDDDTPALDGRAAIAVGLCFGIRMILPGVEGIWSGDMLLKPAGRASARRHRAMIDGPAPLPRRSTSRQFRHMAADGTFEAGGSTHLSNQQAAEFLNLSPRADLKCHIEPSLPQGHSAVDDIRNTGWNLPSGSPIGSQTIRPEQCRSVRGRGGMVDAADSKSGVR
jgi:hypothetical protein